MIPGGWISSSLLSPLLVTIYEMQGRYIGSNLSLLPLEINDYDNHDYDYEYTERNKSILSLTVS